MQPLSSAVLIPEHADIRAMALAQVLPVHETDWALAMRGRVQARMWQYSLTPRESQVAWLLLDGLTNREIAEQLCIEMQTAKIHITNIGRKMFGTERAYGSRWKITLALIGWERVR